MPDPSPGLVAAEPAALAAYGERTSPLEARLAAAGRDLLAIDIPGTGADLAGGVPRARALGAELVTLGARGAAMAATVADVGLAFAAADAGADAGAGAGAGRAGHGNLLGGLLGAVLGARRRAGQPIPEGLFELARRRPELVGSSDAMPPAARYVANRVLAERARDAALAAGDHDRAARFAALADPRRRILLLDPRGDGRVAEVFGADPDAADHVAVVVPGILSTLANHDGELRVKGEALAAETAGLAPGETTSVIALLGYDAPGVLDAPLDDDARDGAAALVALVGGLRANGADDVTVLGHSYGSVVTGAALLEGLDADRVVVTGSPGMLVDNADDLGPTPVYALRAPLDVVSLSEAFGRDPTDPRFGATRLEADGVGHGSYLVPGSMAAAAVAAVVTDRAATAPVDPAHPYEIGAGWLDDLNGAGGDRLAEAAESLEDDLTQALDDIERDLPGPLRDGVAIWRERIGTGFEYGQQAVGLAERISSPDLWVDIALDIDDLVPDEALERVLVDVVTSPVGSSPLGLVIDRFDPPAARAAGRVGR